MLVCCYAAAMVVVGVEYCYSVARVFLEVSSISMQLLGWFWGLQCYYGVVAVVLGSWYFAMQLLRWFLGV